MVLSNIKRYNIFILLSTLSRNIVEVFSAVLLYKMGYSLREIFFFFAILYLVGAIMSVISIYLTKIIKPKYILIISSVIFSGSFYFMTVMEKNTFNLIIFGIIYGMGCYTYHILRHYYAIKALRKDVKRGIGNIVIVTNIALIFSSLISSYIQSKLPLVALSIVIIVISLLGILFLFGFEEEEENEDIKYARIPKNKLAFFILEQAKVINLSIQPLYLYLFVEGTISYIGIFNALIGISSCIFIYFFVKRIDDKKYFKYLNILFCLFLLLKINITNKYLILVIALFEGLGVKMFEVVSTMNMYNITKKTNVKGYLVMVEIVFCLVRFLMCVIGYLINDVIIILYLSTFVTMLVSFVRRDEIKRK